MISLANVKYFFLTSDIFWDYIPDHAGLQFSSRPEQSRLMKPGDVTDIRTGTRLNATSMAMTGEHPVMNGGIKPSGHHNQVIA